MTTGQHAAATSGSFGTAGPSDLDQPQFNGSGATTATVTASGDARIDGLLSGVKWAGGITYSDPDSASDYQAGYSYDADKDGISVQNEGFSQFSAEELLATHFGLNSSIYTQGNGASGFSVEGFTNLDITYGSSGSGSSTIRLANTSDAPTSYAFYPSTNVTGGDVWIGPSARSVTAGNYGWFTIIHELGHALGLKHGHETGGPANTALPPDTDSMEYSIMTYRSYVGQSSLGTLTNGTWGHAQTFMMYDIAALQYMYGADFSINSGSTVYTWSDTGGESYVNGSLAIDPGSNKIFSTVWDGGGNDTYDLSNYTSRVVVNLSPGGYSLFSAAQQAYLGGGPNNGYARGNVFNALQYQGDARSLIENAKGGSGNDSLTGNIANNTLVGGAGNDTMAGGAGNDIYNVDAAGDTVSEYAGEGIDTVYASKSWVMGAGQEIEILRAVYASNATTGIGLTGNERNNSIYGGSKADTLIGGAGNDIMAGREGNDTYNVDSTADTVTEYAGGGIDTVYASKTWAMGATQEIEFLRAYYASNATTGIGLTGNAGNNSIYGGSSSDTLIGGGGNDIMAGREGNDTYNVDATADTVTEYAGGGTDTVYASQDWSMGAGQEIEILRAYYAVNKSTGIKLAGNERNNSIYGGNSGDEINGGAGKDTLKGNGGDDRFFFTAPLNASTNVDTITDFANVSGNDDQFRLDNAVFAALTAVGTLAKALFQFNTTGLATQIDDRIIFETDTGKLFYDADGSKANGVAGVQFALITNYASLTGTSVLSETDFYVV